MNRQWGKLLMYYAGVFTAASVLFTAVWAATDYTEVRFVMLRELKPVKDQIQQLVSSNLQVRWWQLNEKRLKGGGLSFLEMQEFCLISKQLGYVGIPECGI